MGFAGWRRPRRWMAPLGSKSIIWSPSDRSHGSGSGGDLRPTAPLPTARSSRSRPPPHVLHKPGPGSRMRRERSPGEYLIESRATPASGRSLRGERQVDADAGRASEEVVSRGAAPR